MNMKMNFNKNAKYFVMLIGLPGSGKSTWINNLKIVQPEFNFGVLSTDNIIEEIAAEQGLTYSDVWSSNIKGATAQMHENFKDAIKNRRSIVWDQTNCTSKKRKSIVSQVPNEYYKVAVVFTTPLDEIQVRLKIRAEATGKNIPKSVLLNMNDTFEYPTINEGFDIITEE